MQCIFEELIIVWSTKVSSSKMHNSVENVLGNGMVVATSNFPTNKLSSIASLFRFGVLNGLYVFLTEQVLFPIVGIVPTNLPMTYTITKGIHDLKLDQLTKLYQKLLDLDQIKSLASKHFFINGMVKIIVLY